MAVEALELDESFAGESLMQVARDLIGGKTRARSMKVIYAKRPTHDVNTGKPLQCPGWVTWIDNDTRTGAVFVKVAQGWKPLHQYGDIHAYPDEGTSPWDQILRHPDGPAEFPIDQLIEFGWFDAERVPVRGVRFPQLRGQTIRVIPCPDCTERWFIKPIGLAIHCRNAHKYDRQDIQALGRELGVDFVKELYKGRPKEYVYDYDTDEEPAPEVIPDDATVERVSVQGRVQHERRRGTKSQWTPERRAEASRKAKERMARRAAD